MGILTREVKVKPSGKTIQYYRDLGYDAKYLQPLVIKIEDLQMGSHVQIEVLCDMCKENIITVSYDRYNKSIKQTGSFVCKECIPKKRSQTIYDKYGVDNAAKAEQFKEKMRQTNIERYGVPYCSQTKECIEKREKTMLDRYGVINNSQLPDYQEKFRKTCIEKYGESFYNIFSQRAFDTFYKNTGYNNPSQSPVVREKVKQTCIERYGYEYNLQMPEVREKITQTLYVNSSQKVSKQQSYINNLYQGILNFPIKYYNVDIYLPNDNLIVEYDGGGHLLNVKTGRETQEEFNRKEIIRNNVIKNAGYKQIRIISSRDLLPSDQILLQMLSQAKQYFSDYPNHSWIEFNIDTSFVRNAEHKDGIFYSYGELRTIKEVA